MSLNESFNQKSTEFTQLDYSLRNDLNEIFSLIKRLSEASGGYFHANNIISMLIQHNFDVKNIKKSIESFFDLNNFNNQTINDSEISHKDLNSTIFSYLKGAWLQQFDPVFTTKENFHITEGPIVEVDMMNIKKTNFFLNFHSNPFGIEAKACEFPYKNRNVSMTILLPNENSSLKRLEKQILNANFLNKLVNKTVNYQSVSVKLPKFQINFSYQV